jgi:hypothetical protein
VFITSKMHLFPLLGSMPQRILGYWSCRVKLLLKSLAILIRINKVLEIIVILKKLPF